MNLPLALVRPAGWGKERLTEEDDPLSLVLLERDRLKEAVDDDGSLRVVEVSLCPSSRRVAEPNGRTSKPGAGR